MSETVVVALGGNAILKASQRGTVEQQRENLGETARQIAGLIKQGYRVVLTHGNGPQVGNILLQQEEAAQLVPPMPLDVCGAQTQGMIGYLLQQAMGEALRAAGLHTPVITVVAQVEVDRQDEAFLDPSKPVGPFFTATKAQQLAAERGWVVKLIGAAGWRRVVPSPRPRFITELPVINDLVQMGVLVITCGGGGIPVARLSDGRLSGVEAVIDKDLAAEQLALGLAADTLVILTDVPGVAINFGQPDEEYLGKVSVGELELYGRQGHFPAGSMGPKVAAAIGFVRGSGRRAVITAMDLLQDAMHGQAGTIVQEIGLEFNAAEERRDVDGKKHEG
ncbi:MAG TPA: carbamate kinase [Firmicutes bacterium]|nr:carbamate kinase [Bacillota bacterium]